VEHLKEKMLTFGPNLFPLYRNVGHFCAPLDGFTKGDEEKEVTLEMHDAATQQTNVLKTRLTLTVRGVSSLHC
jgi:hypothetical protein